MLDHAEILGHLRRFALDNPKGNAVDKQHNIRDCAVISGGITDIIFPCDMVFVILRVFPVDIMQIERQRSPVSEGFGQVTSQKQRIIYFFTRLD